MIEAICWDVGGVFSGRPVDAIARVAHEHDLDGDEGDWVRLSSPRGEFLAVGTISERLGSAGATVVQPRIVFRT